jgi:uncharacterized RDD family membrane protein YckC
MAASLAVVLTVRVIPQPPDPGDRLVSGEAVEFDVRVARLGSRAVALLIDIVAEVVLAVLLSLVFAVVVLIIGPLADSALTRAGFTVVTVLVFVGYPTVLETLTRGRTLGKLIMGLRVVRDDGGPVRFRHALTRALVGVAVEWPGIALPLVTWVASLWTMLVHPQGRRLGDLTAGTIVIHDRTPAAWGWVPAMPFNLAGWATALDLTGLDDDLALAVRHYLARNHEIREPARSRLGFTLASEVVEVTTPPPPPGTPGWAYLAAVLAERNRRAVLRLARARASTAAVWPDLVDHAHPPLPAWPAPGQLRPAAPVTHAAPGP